MQKERVMSLIYAFRRTTLFPRTDTGNELPTEGRAAYLQAVRALGFEGLELGAPRGSDAEIRGLRRELEDAGLPCRALRGAGPSLQAEAADGGRERMKAGLRAAAAMGAPIYNVTISMPRPADAGSLPWGGATSWGSSRDATEADFAGAATVLADVAPVAAELGVKVSIEIHQHCLADSSGAGRTLMERVGHSAVGLNPDLGNIYWNYHTPEETSEQAIRSLAPLACYWHMKNLVRVHVPQQAYSFYAQATLPDGEIDYRFAVSAMLAAGYRGDFAVEGLRLGDQLRGDGRSLAYVRELLKELTP
jgi:sugar phosphate isomerase/epimerase